MRSLLPWLVCLTWVGAYGFIGARVWAHTHDGSDVLAVLCGLSMVIGYRHAP